VNAIKKVIAEQARRRFLQKDVDKFSHEIAQIFNLQVCLSTASSLSLPPSLLYYTVLASSVCSNFLQKHKIHDMGEVKDIYFPMDLEGEPMPQIPSWYLLFF
jgi:hypothetical protein